MQTKQQSAITSSLTMVTEVKVAEVKAANAKVTETKIPVEERKLEEPKHEVSKTLLKPQESEKGRALSNRAVLRSIKLESQKFKEQIGESSSTFRDLLYYSLKLQQNGDQPVLPLVKLGLSSKPASEENVNDSKLPEAQRIAIHQNKQEERGKMAEKDDCLTMKNNLLSLIEV